MSEPEKGEKPAEVEAPEGAGLGDMAKGMLWNPDSRAFFIYLMFVILFSVVTFVGKPPVVQYELNSMFKENFEFETVSEDVALDSTENFYNFMAQGMGPLLFPNFDADGSVLSEQDRLFVSGRGRILSAIRLRQARNKQTSCDIPGYLKEVYGKEVLCLQDYSASNRDKSPIKTVGSAAYIDLGNFTRPFLYQNYDALNSTRLYKMGGGYGRYHSDGFVLDIIPNLSARRFASELEKCASSVISSLQACVTEFNVTADITTTPTAPTTTPAPTPPTEAANAPVLMIQEAFANGTAIGDRKFELSYVLEFENNAQTYPITFLVHNTGSVTMNWVYDQASLEQYGTAPDWIDVGASTTGTLIPSDSQTKTITVSAGSFWDSATDGIATMDPKSPLSLIIKDSVFPGVQSTIRFEVIYNKTATATSRRLQGADGLGRKLLSSRVESERRATAALSSSSRRRLTQAANTQSLEGCSSIPYENVANAIPSGLVEHLPKCQFVNSQPGLCQLNYVPLDTMVSFMAQDKCGECGCKPDSDVGCSTSCSTIELFNIQLARLRAANWIDEKTRAVILEFSLLNAESNLVTNVAYLVELTSFGLFKATYKIQTYKIFIYDGYEGMVLAVLQLIFVAYILWYTFLELLEIRAQGWAYLKDFWNYVDWANLIILYIVIGLKLSSYLIMNRFDFEALTVTYIDFPPLGYFATQELNVAAVNFFLLYFKIFKFLYAVPRMNSMIKTCSRIVVDIFFFLVMATIVMFGFCAAFYMVFGADLAEFKTLGDSLGALMRLTLGDFDYFGMSQVNTIMTPFLFYLFVTFVFMILLNMFLAIIADAYSEVKEEETEEDINFYTKLAEQLGAQMKALVFRRNRVNQLVKELKTSDKNADDLIDIDELKEALKDHPTALLLLESSSPQELLKKYDVDSDGVLDKEEMTTILKQLAKKEAEIEEEIRRNEESETDALNRSRNFGKAVSGVHVDMSKLEDRVDLVDKQLKELNRGVSKKLSLMVDLLMSLSDQVSHQGNGTPGSQLPPPPFQMNQRRL